MQRNLYCYKIQFILFLLTPDTRNIGHAWPSTNHFNDTKLDLRMNRRLRA